MKIYLSVASIIISLSVLTLNYYNTQKMKAITLKMEADLEKSKANLLKHGSHIN